MFFFFINSIETFKKAKKRETDALCNSNTQAESSDEPEIIVDDDYVDQEVESINTQSVQNIRKSYKTKINKQLNSKSDCKAMKPKTDNNHPVIKKPVKTVKSIKAPRIGNVHSVNIELNTPSIDNRQSVSPHQSTDNQKLRNEMFKKTKCCCNAQECFQKLDNKIDSMFLELKKMLKLSITDVHHEVSIVRQMLKNYNENKIIQKMGSPFYEQFPLGDDMQFDILERKLTDIKFFESLEKKLTQYINQNLRSIGSTKHFCTEMFPVLFDTKYAISLSWTTFPLKREISSSKLIHLLQSMLKIISILNIILICSIIYFQNVLKILIEMMKSSKVISL